MKKKIYIYTNNNMKQNITVTQKSILVPRADRQTNKPTNFADIQNYMNGTPYDYYYY